MKNIQRSTNVTKKVLLSLFLFLLAGKVSAVDITNAVPDIASPQAVGGGAGFINWVQNFYQFSLIAGVFLAVGVITWAGLKYALAAGNPSGQSDARDQILQALLGLVLLFGAYLILFTINPNLTNLSLPTLTSVSVGGVGGNLGSASTMQSSSSNNSPLSPNAFDLGTP